MQTRTCDVVVIGAGTAGLHAYQAAEASGARVFIVERGPGGSTCARVGCMPSKLLIAAGRAAEHARRAGLFGIGVQEVAVDGAAVFKRLRAERDRFVQSVLDDYHAIPTDRRFQGEARFTGSSSISIGDHTEITAASIIVATGAHPAIPDALRPVVDLVETNETIFDIDRLPRALAVVGAGPLGLELAQAFARLGVAVTVLDEADTVGHLTDPEAAAEAHRALSRSFELRLGVKVTARRAEDGRAEIRWTGDHQGATTVDRVLAATGRPPNLADLNLAAAGVQLDRHGVPCFDHATRRCGSSNIFIAGDAGAWRPVLHEAALGGCNAGDVARGRTDTTQVPALAITFTEPNLVEVGARFDALPNGAKIGTARVSDNGRARIDGEQDGVVRLYADDAGKLIGATIVATGGEHLGQLVALGIDRGLDAKAFANQAWYHPTLEEMLEEAARDLEHQAR